MQWHKNARASGGKKRAVAPVRIELSVETESSSFASKVPRYGVGLTEAQTPKQERHRSAMVLRAHQEIPWALMWDIQSLWIQVPSNSGPQSPRNLQEPRSEVSVP